MATATLSDPMAKRNDTAVKIDSEVVRKAKIVAAYRDLSIAEFISNELGAIVDRLLDEEHAKEKGKGSAAGPKRGRKGEA